MVRSNPCVRLSSVRPLVRYVDEDQAVIDVHLCASPRWPDQPRVGDLPLNVMLEITGSDGFHDEGVTRLRLVNGEAAMRFDMVQPRRWWPASMGEQPLYEFTVRLIDGDADHPELDERIITLGLTSVRPSAHGSPASALLVNGRLCEIESLVTVDRVDENQLLPATGDSLLLVRDHYGPDVLYEAADRAGILLIQCVPIHPQATPEADVATQVNRLSGHPSLAGWFVGHLGRLSDRVAGCIAALDPTRTVFRELPLAG